MQEYIGEWKNVHPHDKVKIVMEDKSLKIDIESISQEQGSSAISLIDLYFAIIGLSNAKYDFSTLQNLVFKNPKGLLA